MATNANKAELKGYLNGPGLTKALEVWFKNQRRKKLAGEVRKTKLRLSSDETEEGQQDVAMRLFDERVEDIMQMREDAQSMVVTEEKEKTEAERKKVEEEKKEEAWAQLSKRERKRQTKKDNAMQNAKDEEIQNLNLAGEEADKEKATDREEEATQGDTPLEDQRQDGTQPMPLGIPREGGDERVREDRRNRDQRGDEVENLNEGGARELAAKPQDEEETPTGGNGKAEASKNKGTKAKKKRNRRLRAADLISRA